MKRGCLSWLLVLAFGCAQPEREVSILQSRCLTDAECGAEEQCDLARQQCYRERPDHPYLVVLKVYAASGNVPLVREFNYRFTLTDNDEELEIVVPESSEVTSLVSSSDTPRVESEVTFTPLGAGALTERSIIATSLERATGDGPNLSARLTPATSYQVNVQPLIEASRKLPPMTRTYDPDQGLDLSYAPVTKLDFKLLDTSDKKMIGLRVRLEDAATGSVLSSTTKVDDSGDFSLYADSTLLGSALVNLAVSLREETPWQTTVAIGVPLNSDVRTTVTMPELPAEVSFYGFVRDQNGAVVPYAELLFESTFPFDPNVTSYVGDRDWCRGRKNANVDTAPRCRARMTTVADETGEFGLSALPGEYKIFATPNSADAASRSLATSELGGTSGIETRLVMGTRQGPQDVPLSKATRFSGVISTFDGRRMPNVTVTARALGFKGIMPEVARFNRSVTSATDRRGRFQLATDIGYYNLVIEPPPDSGFAWSGSLNRIVGTLGSDTVDRILPAPVYVTGTVMRKAMQRRTLPGTRIEAYALVSALSGGQRAIRIGQTVTGQDGAFRLALPGTVGEELCNPKERAQCDCGPGQKPVPRECDASTGTFKRCECPVPQAATMGN